MVRNFGGDDRPEELVQNRDLDKELVRNFGQNDGFIMPEDVKFVHPDLEKDILKGYDIEDKEINPTRSANVTNNAVDRRRGDEDLTE